MTCCPQAEDNTSDFKSVRFESTDCRTLPERVLIPGGTGLIGTSAPHIRTDGEGPIRRGLVDPFYMSQSAITNAQFAAFIKDTGYITEAEHLGWSFVFFSQLPDDAPDTRGVPGSPWWRQVDRASWQCLSGAECTLVTDLSDHPVVHVSWNDANAYCSWVGGRLPTELEWEHAARADLGDVRFPWGNTEPDDEENFLCNIWQGRFPNINTVKDGYDTTAPGLSFKPNDFGLYNMVGNVWEWTADAFRTPALRKQKNHHGSENPEILKVVKGGSFLCHKSYCYRYRIAARSGNTIDSATTHTGFRVAWNS